MASKDERDLAKAARKARLLKMRFVRKQEEGDELYKRQVEEDRDPFEVYYSKERLVQPPYSFVRLYKIYEESDMLQECIEAYQQNVDGFGYQMQFLGDDVKDKDTTDALNELEKAENFFDQVNDEQSMMTIRKLMRQDYEVLGNGAFEIVRNLYGQPQMIFYMPFIRLRVAQIERTPVTVTIQVMREGKLVDIKVKKFFRRYAQISVTGQKLRWFKSYGDPRTLDALTGEYVTDGTKPKLPASEIMHFKQAFGDSVYGLPRWIGAVLDVLGRRSSQFVNYDLFESQGIPPMAVMVSGGALTDESIEDIENMLDSLRGAGKWNRCLVLESTPESQGLEDKGNAKIELKNLSEYRKEDQMFATYLQSTERTIRHRFRLPPLYVGAAETFTHATAKSAKEVAEEQIFVPERASFDEIINTRLCPDLDITLWKYSTRGPQIVGAEEISSGVSAFAQTGAFTINHAIDMANAAFGLQMSKFNEDWANYPFPLVSKLLELNRLKGVEKIAEEAQEPAPSKPFGGLLPQRAGADGEGEEEEEEELEEKHAYDVVMKSDMFTEEEKAMYKRLRTIQFAIESKSHKG